MVDFGDWSGEIYDILSVDVTLISLITGGFYLYRDMPESFNRNTMPDAYDDTTKFLLPTMVIKGRDPIPTGEVRSNFSSVKFTVVNQTIEIWMYRSAVGNWDALNQAAARVYQLLEQEKVEQTWNIELLGQTNIGREPLLRDAPFILQEYRIKGRL